MLRRAGLDMTESIKISILVDDKAKEGLAAEHGFAVWVAAAGRQILFDTGQGFTLPGNADKLGVSLSDADFLVLSHGHYDHGDGISFVLERAPDIHLFCHPEVSNRRYSVQAGAARAIHISDAARYAIQKIPPDKLHWIAQPFGIAPDLGVTGPIPRATDYEDTGGPFFLDADGKQPDPINDDNALWVQTGKGLVVIVGCSHAGLINTLNAALRVSGASRLHAVIGGFHLLQASEKRLESTASALKKLNPDLVVPCHCTGDLAVERLRRELGDRVSPGYAGASYLLGET